MNDYCENQLCENPGAKEVPVSVEKASDQRRTLCSACEEAYVWGVQHGKRVAKAGPALSRLDKLLRRGGLVILAGGACGCGKGFQARAFSGPVELQVQDPVSLGRGAIIRDALEALDHKLAAGVVGTENCVRLWLEVDDRELATILAALRFHQDENLQGPGGRQDQAIGEIATNAGTLAPLTYQEVGDLCERLNVTPTSADWQDCEHQWQETSGPSTGCGTKC